MKSGNQILPVKMGLKTEKGNFFFNNLEQETGKIKPQIICRHASRGKERKCQKDDPKPCRYIVVLSILHCITSLVAVWHLTSIMFLFSAVPLVKIHSTPFIMGRGGREGWFENMMALYLFIIWPYGMKRWWFLVVLRLVVEKTP